MAITRRQFIKRTGLATAGDAPRPEPLRESRSCARRSPTRSATATSSCSSSTAATTASTRSCPYDGSGALRTAYEHAHDRRRRHQSVAGRRSAGDHRSATIRTPARSSPSIPGSRGLNGSSTTLGKVAVIQGCGYPDYSLSHEESRDIWQTGNPLGYSPLAGTGWVGRHLAARVRRQRTIPGVSISDSVSASSGRPARACSPSSRLRRLRLPLRRRLRATTTPAQARRVPGALRRRPPAARSRSAATSATPAASTLLSSESYPAGARRLRDRAAGERQATPTTTSTAARRATSARSRRSSTPRSARRRAAQRQRPLLPAEQRRLRHALRPGRRRAGRPALRPASPRSATRSRSSTTTSRTWASANRRLHRGVERVQPPHPAERQRHRPRLAGTDVRDRRRR